MSSSRFSFSLSQVDLAEFVAHLNEPRERRPLIKRLFDSLDTNDFASGAQSDALDTFEFFLGVYSFCSLPQVSKKALFCGVSTVSSPPSLFLRFVTTPLPSPPLPQGDYLLKFLWDLYDPKRKGFITEATARELEM